MMKITCDNCQATYTIADEKIAGRRARISCRSCGENFMVDARSSVKTEAAVPPSPEVDQEVRMGNSPSNPEGLLAVEHPLFQAFPDLRRLRSGPFALDEIFTPDKKGRYQNGINKLKAKLLATVAETVGKILDREEKVRRVGKGVAYYPAELMFGNGYLTTYYNHYAIICTDNRVLFININSGATKVTHYLQQLPYNGIKKIKKGSLFGRLFFYRAKGARRLFNGVKRQIMNEIHDYVMEKLTSAIPATAPASEHLCPACFKSLPIGLNSCSACSASFKKASAAALRSLILPGVGDMYLGHRALGALELLGALIVWLVVIAMNLDGNQEELFLAGFLLVFVNGFDGIMTYFMARKGYMLA